MGNGNVERSSARLNHFTCPGGEITDGRKLTKIIERFN